MLRLFRPRWGRACLDRHPACSQAISDRTAGQEGSGSPPLGLQPSTSPQRHNPSIILTGTNPQTTRNPDRGRGSRRPRCCIDYAVDIWRPRDLVRNHLISITMPPTTDAAETSAPAAAALIMAIRCRRFRKTMRRSASSTSSRPRLSTKAGGAATGRIRVSRCRANSTSDSNSLHASSPRTASGTAQVRTPLLSA